MCDKGTYQGCTNCNSEVVCCCYFDQINAPVLNECELQKIKQLIKRDDFYTKLGDNLFSLNLSENNCVFYDNGKCSIYDERPVDCKLYPFDIVKEKEKYYLILYLLNCIDYEAFYDESFKIEPLINDVIPWIDIFTDEQNFTKMKKKKYKVIREIKI